MQSRLLSSLKPATQTCIETGQPPNSACSITAAYLLHSDDDGGVMTASSSAHSSVAPPHLRLRLDSPLRPGGHGPVEEGGNGGPSDRQIVSRHASSSSRVGNGRGVC